MIQVVGLAIAFILVIALNARKVNVGLAIMVAAIALAISCGHSVHGFIELIARSLQDPETITLTSQVTAIGLLAYCMKETKLVDDLISGLRTILSNRALIAVMPAVIGLMPVPGGALLSAPLIDEEAEKLELTPERKVTVNLTFRHIWFYVSPLSSVLILASGLAGMSLYQLIIMQVPSFILSVALGYLLFLRHLDSNMEPQVRRAYGPVVGGLAPILVAVALNLIGVNLAISVMLAVLLAFTIKRTGPSRALKLLWKGMPWTVALSVVSVMIFRYTIEDSKAIPLLFDILKEANVPLLVFATIFPFTIAAVSGLAIAGAGISIPFILPLFPVTTPALVSLIVLSTYAGYYISPLHLCLVLSNQYFKAKISEVYRLWVPYLLAVCCFGIVIDILLLSR